MSSGWTGISEGQDTGNEVEAKLTSAFDNLDKDVVAVDNKANTIGLALGFTKRIGVDVDTLIAFGLYEVDTNIPSPILLGELSVVMINGTALVVQTLMDTGSHYEYERVTGDGGAHWTPWVETGTSLAMSATIAAFTDTATKEYVNNSIVNRYSGLNHPNIDLGKEGDKYHQFQTSADVDIQTGTASNDYYHIYFELYGNASGTGDIGYIDVYPSENAIEIEWLSSVHEFGALTLRIGTTDIPLTVVSQSPTFSVLAYDPSFQHIMESIVITTPFVLHGLTLSGKETDFYKHEGEWLKEYLLDNSYDYSSGGIPATGNPIVTTSNSYTDIADVDEQLRSAGVYEVTFSTTFLYNGNNRAAYFQWSINDGLDWEEVRITPKDANDLTPFTYTFPWERGEGPMKVVFQARCENAGDTLTINYSNIVVERKR